MVADEVAVENDVAVDLDDVVALARRDGLVTDHRQAETVVFVPDMLDGAGQCPRKRLDDPTGGFSRAVVGDDHLEGRRALCGDTLQTEGQGFGPVVGRDQKGDFHRQVRY